MKRQKTLSEISLCRFLPDELNPLSQMCSETSTRSEWKMNDRALYNRHVHRARQTIGRLKSWHLKDARLKRAYFVLSLSARRRGQICFVVSAASKFGIVETLRFSIPVRDAIPIDDAARTSRISVLRRRLSDAATLDFTSRSCLLRAPFFRSAQPTAQIVRAIFAHESPAISRDDEKEGRNVRDKTQRL